MSMMTTSIMIASWIQSAVEVSGRAFHTVRRWLIPFVLWGGYDMVLLNTGVWVHEWRGGERSSEDWTAVYSAKSHCITVPGTVSKERKRRCNWLSFQENADLTLFFERLTMSPTLQISPNALLLLAFNQTGQIAPGPWTVQTRTGESERVTFN